LPSDANGVYSLPTGYLAVTGEVIQASQHNPPLEDIATALTGRLTRSGAAPMTGPLKVVDGSIGSPAIQFSNAPSTGIYKTTNGFGIAVAGTKVAEFGPGGIVSGARWIGELVPFTGLTAPALTVFPQGQTLSRTTYADLWTFAQNEIANGNAFYNNGDGSTTFGIGDMRGRVAAALDPSATVLNSATISGGAGGIGNRGGQQTHGLSASEIPTITSAGSANVTVPAPNGNNFVTAPNGGIQQLNNVAGAGVVNATFTAGTAGALVANTGAVLANGPANVSSNNTGGADHNNVQPTMMTNYVLFAGA